MPASPAARQPRPDTAPTRPPSPAGARALAHSRPHFLFSLSRAERPSSALAAPAAPPASSSRTTAPFPDSSRPQLRLALLQAALELAPPSEHRSSLPASRHRRPWRRRARPPWKPSSFSSPASPSYPTALAFSSHIPCARQLALPWPEMAAGRWPSRAAAPARTPARHSTSASPAGQAESGRGPRPCQAAALPFCSVRVGQMRPWAGCSPWAGPVFLK